MVRGPQVVGVGLVLAAVLGLSFFLLGSTRAQTTERCFSETGFCIEGAFRPVWERGGLTIYGFPLRPLQQAAPGAPLSQLQWFERQRFELHPGNPPPYTVQLGRLGAERLAQLGRDWQAAPPAAPQPGCRYFRETGRNLCSPFLEYWQASGLDLDGRTGVSFAESLALFGLPLSEAQEEQIDGRTYLVQWFERARFELHPENPAASRVLLGRLGAELLAGGAGGDAVVAVTPVALPPTATGASTATRTPAATATGAAGGQAPRTPTPTRRPRATAEPELATDTPEPSSTAEPPTRTPLVPTSTPVPPTSTPAPPTPTPRPDPFTSPGTKPPNFNDSGGLPSASAGGRPLQEFNATTDSPYNIGQNICIDLQPSPPPDPPPPLSGEQSFTIAAADSSIVETGTVILNAPTTTLRWRWVPGLGYAPGVYTITADNLPISGTITLQSPAPGSGANIVVVRTDTRLNEDDINQCNDTIFGQPGDEFGVVMTGFAASEEVNLYLYGTAGCAEESGQACFLGLLETVTVNAQGQAYLQLPTLPSYPSGRYIVLTEQQARATLNQDTSNFQADWPQRFTLR